MSDKFDADKALEAARDSVHSFMNNDGECLGCMLLKKERDELKEENKVLKASLRNLHNYEIVKLKNDLDSAIGRFSAIVCRKAKCDIDLEREGE